MHFEYGGYVEYNVAYIECSAYRIECIYGVFIFSQINMLN